MGDIIPLRERKLDWILIIFFILNLTIITYIVDLEQLVIKDPNNFEYPVWPPAFMIDNIHWYAQNFDPPQLAREMWWKMTIWIDVLFFGPFYAFAIYAFVKGRQWIRIPSIIWASVMLTNVTIILGEELAGRTPAPNFLIVLGFNALWLIMPIIVLLRMGLNPTPFRRKISSVQPA